jgi:hypothetical protein
VELVLDLISVIPDPLSFDATNAQSALSLGVKSLLQRGGSILSDRESVGEPALYSCHSRRHGNRELFFHQTPPTEHPSRNDAKFFGADFQLLCALSSLDRPVKSARRVCHAIRPRAVLFVAGILPQPLFLFPVLDFSLLLDQAAPDTACGTKAVSLVAGWYVVLVSDLSPLSHCHEATERQSECSEHP